MRATLYETTARGLAAPLRCSGRTVDIPLRDLLRQIIASRDTRDVVLEVDV